MNSAATPIHCRSDLATGVRGQGSASDPGPGLRQGRGERPNREEVSIEANWFARTGTTSDSPATASSIVICEPRRMRLGCSLRLPDREPIHPKQDDGLERSPNEEINGAPGVTADRDVVDRRVDVYWKEHYQNRGSNPPSDFSGLWREEASCDCKLQNSRQIHEQRSFRNPWRQHLRHGVRLREMSETREHKHSAKSGRGKPTTIEVTARHC